MQSPGTIQPLPAGTGSIGIAPEARKGRSVSDILVIMVGIVNIAVGAYLLYSYLDLQSASFGRNEGFDLFLPLLVVALCLGGWFLVSGLVANKDWARIPAASVVTIAGVYLLYTYLTAQLDRLGHNQGFDSSIAAGLMLSFLYLASGISLFVGRAWPRILVLTLSGLTALSLALAVLLLLFGEDLYKFIFLTIGLAAAGILVGQAWPRVIATVLLILTALDITVEIFVVAKGDTLLRLLLIVISVASIISAVGLIKLREWGRTSAVGLYTLSTVIGLSLLSNNPWIIFIITLLMVFMLILLESASVFTSDSGSS